MMIPRVDTADEPRRLQEENAKLQEENARLQTENEGLRDEVEAHRSDLAIILDEVGAVYSEITGGQFSSPFTEHQHVLDAAQEITRKRSAGLSAALEREMRDCAIFSARFQLAANQRDEIATENERIQAEWSQEYARVKMELNGWLRQASGERDKFERWFLGAAQERDELQKRDLKRVESIIGWREIAEEEHAHAGAAEMAHEDLLQAAREARAGHAGRLFGLLDEADRKGK